jgi:bis(5'-nucleosyl)-tetraphosphatase (symmetrical)
LLNRIGWRPERDRLWLVGDLVNRGPSSLEVLRWAFANRDHLTAVLGNHDLHLLLRARGLVGAKADDTLDEVLGAGDRDQLLGWLQARPFLYRRGSRLLVHAGILPSWDLDAAEDLSRQLTEKLRGADAARLLAAMATAKRRWRPDLEGDERLCAAASVFTRLRMVRADGQPRLGFTGAPDLAPDGDRPWFELSTLPGGSFSVVFGHWAQLRFLTTDGVLCLDSGCVYGGSLSAVRLDDGRAVHEPCADRVAAS